MSGYLTADHHVKKKKNKTDLSLSEDVFYSEHPELEGSEEKEEEEEEEEKKMKKKKKKKKKSKHRSTDDETLMDVSSLDNLSPSCSRSISSKFKGQEDTSEQVLSNQDYNSDTWKSPKKRKKKKHIEVPVDEAVEETDHTGQPSLYDSHGMSDEVAVSGEVLHRDSVRKKKKRHRPSDTGSLKEEVLEDVQQTSSEVAINLDIDVENPVRKKKKKHKYTFLEEENFSHGIQQTVELNSPFQVVSKKSRQKGNKVSVEETGHTGQPSLYDSPGYSDEVAVSEEVLHSESVRKKKKKHRPSETRSLKEEVLETSPLVTVNEDNNVENSGRKKKKRHQYDILEKENVKDGIQQTVELSNPCRVASKKPRQKNKEVSVEETDHTGQPSLYDGHTDEVPVSEEALYSESARKKKKRHRATGEDSTFSDERESRTDGCLSPNVRNSDKVTVTEDLSFNENTDLESSERKKKKKHRTKEVDSQTESSICKPFKRYTSPEPNGEDVVVAERSKKKSGKYLDATAEETSENITEATNGEEDAENAGVPEKRRKSIKLEPSEGNQDQDVTAELEESDRNQMETSLDAETSVWRPKRRIHSANEILCTIPERDLALLEEYFPKIRSRAVRTVEDLIIYELHRIKEAKAKGIMFETGRFSRTEDELIKTNVEAFMKLAGLQSGEVLFHSYRFPDEKRTIEKLKKKFHFRQRIAIGLARPVREVQNRGSKLYDLSGNKGRFTKEDVEKLQKGISEYGNNWTAVAKLVGRNNTHTQLKASQLRHEFTGGKWSVEEVNLLLKAVKKFIRRSLKKKGENVSRMEPQTVPKEMLFAGIPWAKIERKVKTRNWTHCKSKWNDILLVRMNNGIRSCERFFGLQANIDIIKWLHEAELRKGQVNWLEMAKAIGNIPPGILQQKVYKLKARHVPDWQSLNFKEIVDHLYQEVLPKLEARMMLASSQDTFDLPEKKDEFLIKDIFEEYVGDDKYHLSQQFCVED
ncbi:transcription termination factor 1 isoform X2 [Lithobates pipiens]